MVYSFHSFPFDGRLPSCSSPSESQMTQPQQSSLERTQPAHKSLQALEATERASARLFTVTQDAQAPTPQILKGPRILQGPSPGQTAATADLPRSCAHILVYVAPPSADDKMMIKVPWDDSNPTPTFQGLPPCSRDFRPMFFATLGPEFRFMKPGRNDSPLPGLEKPSSLTQPK